jgi:hypothetical protein
MEVSYPQELLFAQTQEITENHFWVNSQTGALQASYFGTAALFNRAESLICLATQMLNARPESATPGSGFLLVREVRAFISFPAFLAEAIST